MCIVCEGPLHTLVNSHAYLRCFNRIWAIVPILYTALTTAYLLFSSISLLPSQIFDQKRKPVKKELDSFSLKQQMGSSGLYSHPKVLTKTEIVLASYLFSKSSRHFFLLSNIHLNIYRALLKRINDPRFCHASKKLLQTAHENWVRINDYMSQPKAYCYAHTCPFSNVIL